jgi:hypothetical protein
MRGYKITIRWHHPIHGPQIDNQAERASSMRVAVARAIASWFRVRHAQNKPARRAAEQEVEIHARRLS